MSLFLINTHLKVRHSTGEESSRDNAKERDDNDDTQDRTQGNVFRGMV